MKKFLIGILFFLILILIYSITIDKKSIFSYFQAKKEWVEKKKEIKSLKNQSQLLKTKINKLKDDSLRYAAEIDNLRKRFDKEKEDIYKYAITDFANEIILVVDNFERMLENVSSIDNKNNEKLKPVIEGIELTFKNFVSRLEKF